MCKGVTANDSYPTWCNHATTHFTPRSIFLNGLFLDPSATNLRRTMTSSSPSAGTLALASLALPATQIAALIAYKYSLRRKVGIPAHPIVSFRTQQIPIFTAVGCQQRRPTMSLRRCSDCSKRSVPTPKKTWSPVSSTFLKIHNDPIASISLWVCLFHSLSSFLDVPLSKNIPRARHPSLFANVVASLLTGPFAVSSLPFCPCPISIPCILHIPLSHHRKIPSWRKSCLAKLRFLVVSVGGDAIGELRA
ncbi:hypothetical protein ARMSODRAFT_290277 [Armillaria solidipes]|uniref:Uncharacterized protein n=1 Tax=Armillaria solidipes TaxID=1076256 RepID=A0A2H3C3G0_9AGAR|nr:hypothetical protein ARMSODRAFT_290277 [Armillaria solidipes]